MLVRIVVADALVLKHQVISIHNTDLDLDNDYLHNLH